MQENLQMEKIGIAAAILVRGMGDMNVKYGETEVDLLSALKADEVTENLLKSGLHALDTAAEGVGSGFQAQENVNLILILLHYALGVAPRIEGRENIIDLDRLMELVEGRSARRGVIAIDPMLVLHIQHYAEMMQSNEIEGNAASPGRSGENS